MKLVTWFKSRFLKTRKPLKKEGGLPEAVIWQTTLLQDNDLIVYTDEKGENHLLCRKPLDKTRDYQVIYINYNDVY